MTLPLFLVVDDEEGIRESLFDFLEMALDGQAKVVTASSAQEALGLLDAHSGDAPIVLTDFNMGPSSKNGLELLAEVQRRWPASRRLLMTGYSLEEVTRGGAPQVHRAFEKPFSPTDLLAAAIPPPP